MSGITQPLVTDAVVVGGGPVGLFQVFQLGLLGLHAEIIDVLPDAGGQCMALYPDKPIYDIPGVPRCTGRELTAQLLAQARPFMPADPATGRPRNLHLRHQVETLAVVDPSAGSSAGASAAASPDSHPRFALTTDRGLHLHASAVFIAAGAGAFVPRAWPIPGLPADAPIANLHHDLGDTSAVAPWAGQHVAVAGGGDEALQAVIDLSEAPADRQPAAITLIHRRDQFQAEPVLEAQVRALLARGRVTLAIGVPQGAATHHDGNDGATRLRSVDLLGPDGQTRTLPLDHLIVRLGLSPKLGPINQWGLPMERKQLGVSPATFETAIPGIHAVGDINTYPGKKRLLLCGFHEATLAAYAAAARLRPDEPQHLQYTTTSTLLHRRLGLE